MKIGIFTPYLNHLTGGEKYILTSASCLSLHHQVDLFWDPQQETDIKAKAKEKFGITLQKVRFVENIFNKRTSFIYRLIKTKKYDKIFFLSDGSIPFVLCKLSLHFQFPVEWVNGKNLKTKIKLSRVDNILCNSQFTKSYIDKMFGIQSAVLYPPCDIQQSSKKKENIILHVGRLGMNHEGSNYKKQDVMIDVFKKLADKGLSNWKFILIMSVRDIEKEKLEDLRNLAKGYPIEFIVNSEKSIVSTHYSKAKIYWHASGFGEDLQKHPERAEHFGIATVEAMAAGCVPVVINKGGQPEIVESEKNGYLWDTREELITYTLGLVKNQKLLNSLSENAKDRAKKFSTEIFCENVKKYFNE